MRRALLVAIVVSLAVLPASGDDLSGRAVVSYQNYDYGFTSSAGLRQTYDFRLDRALTMTSIVRLMFRGDDFRGTQTTPRYDEKQESRQLQPIGEFLLRNDTLSIQARTDYLDISSRYADRENERTIERTSGQLIWQPVDLPRLTLLGQRTAIDDAGGNTALTEQNASAVLEYTWRGLTVSGDGRYTTSSDPRLNFERNTNSYAGSLAYNASAMSGRLEIAGQADGRQTNVDERATGPNANIPVPVAANRAFFGIDDTPSDDRDHPLSPYPALKDGNQNSSAGISLGPESVSFQNLAIDIGRVEQVDEIRVIVRDAAGNPMRNGGGPVTWDAYASDDGQIWTPILTTGVTFNTSLSLYSVTFPLINTRWVKVVSFGVNAEATYVTEVQAYYHVTITSGAGRSGTQQLVNGVATVSYRPVDRLLLSYSGVYSSMQQDYNSFGNARSTSLEHVGGIEYALARAWAARGQYIRRNSESLTGEDTADVISTFVDYKPTMRLRLTLELGRQTQTLVGSSNSIDIRALHLYGQVYRSWLINMDAGVETQTIDSDRSVSRRRFFALNSGAQLYRSLRLQLLGSMQEVDSESSDPAVALLGPARDNRASAELIWRPGRPLLISTRVGWVNSLNVSGLTQRFRAEWYPFADGTLSLGGYYDEDIDPVYDRRARRLVFNPRWAMNRWATFDVNYTAVSSSYSTVTNEQRTLFATLTLTR